MCRPLISVVKAQHSWAGYPMEPSSFPYPQTLLKGMPVLCSATAHGATTNLLLPKDLSWSPFYQENCHCPTHLSENMAQIPSASNSRLIKETLGWQAESRLLTAAWDLALNLKRNIPPSSFHDCNSVIPLCKCRINVLTLLRLFCSNSGLNEVWTSLTYACFQSRAANLWQQQLTPKSTAKIPAGGTKAGSAVGRCRQEQAGQLFLTPAHQAALHPWSSPDPEYMLKQSKNNPNPNPWKLSLWMESRFVTN